jgi:hypothetical protein
MRRLARRVGKPHSTRPIGTSFSWRVVDGGDEQRQRVLAISLSVVAYDLGFVEHQQIAGVAVLVGEHRDIEERLCHASLLLESSSEAPHFPCWRPAKNRGLTAAPGRYGLRCLGCALITSTM